MNGEVYLPICVVITAGKVVGFDIDWEGAPWMSVTDTDNVWAPQGDPADADTWRWCRDDSLEQMALDWLSDHNPVIVGGRLFTEAQARSSTNAHDPQKGEQ
jgi:hypothetical protein